MILDKQKNRWAGWSALWGLAAPLAPLALAQPVAAAEDSAVHFDVALQHLERCQWPLAYQQFAVLADAGHGQAARIALLMQALGTRVFGGRYPAQASQRNRWLDVAAAQAAVSAE